MKIVIKALVLCASLLTMSTAWAEQKVKITTNVGTIIIELNQEAAPLTVANFLSYIENGSYNNSIFHRVIKDFMIQGGGFSTGREKLATHTPVKNESNNKLSNMRGSIAMARTNSPHSATRQFFINHKDNNFLDANSGRWGYTVFGKVIEGMDVVDRIAATPTGRDAKLGMKDVPKTPIFITNISLIKKEKSLHVSKEAISKDTVVVN